MAYVHINGVSVPAGFDTGRKTVSPISTAVPLVSESTPCINVEVTALSENLGLVYVGSRANMTAADGRELAAGASVYIETDDLESVYLLVDTDNEGVSYLYHYE